MKTIRLHDELTKTSKTPVRIDATCWSGNEDTFAICVLVRKLRDLDVKKIVLFLPRLPYYYCGETPERAVFCDHINQLKLNAIETYSGLGGSWAEELLRVFQVKNDGFIDTVMSCGDFTLATSNTNFLNKNVLLILENYNRPYILQQVNRLLRDQPRTINLVCKHFETVQNQRDALDYFDRVFAPELDKHFVDGIEQIPFERE